MAPGTSAKLDILRRGETKSITVTLATMPNQPEKQARSDDNGTMQGTMQGTPRLGLSVAPASEVAGAGNEGVVITAVDPEGPAAGRGLTSRDRSLDGGGQSVGHVPE